MFTAVTMSSLLHLIHFHLPSVSLRLISNSLYLVQDFRTYGWYTPKPPTSLPTFSKLNVFGSVFPVARGGCVAYTSINCTKPILKVHDIVKRQIVDHVFYPPFLQTIDSPHHLLNYKAPSRSGERFSDYLRSKPLLPA